MPGFRNHSGETYGRLTVQRFSHRDKHNKHVYECLCQCGTVTLVRLNNLRSGGTVSCGCHRQQVIYRRVPTEPTPGTPEFFRLAMSERLRILIERDAIR